MDAFEEMNKMFNKKFDELDKKITMNTNIEEENKPRESK